ncbi:DUF2127 domain-containing protein [Mesorhizobium sp. Cs1321R2N1]|uniref:DUF2127 domain-containing protein n=1 Tax=Mesorhizobium sp. Cs1321R2N1 TaxID=3015174 RepID=UPI00301CDD05
MRSTFSATVWSKLVAALLKRRLWAYPASLAALLLFIIYQLYRFSYTHSAGLIVLTLFDLLVVWLVWHEYRLVQSHKIEASWRRSRGRQ